METKLETALSAVEVVEPVMAGHLQVFGLRWNLPGDLSYMTLDEAMEDELLEVTEVDESGRVPEVKVTNKGDLGVFLMAGEHLLGAKQDRVLNASMMVAANGETVVPVSCVEMGRWGYLSRKFKSGGSASHSRLRRLMSKGALKGYRRAPRPSSDQNEVWDEVDRKLRAMGSKSPSHALLQAYEDRREKLDGAVVNLRLPEDCCGAVFAFGGRVAGVELFDKPETLAKVMPKLVKAYALDALEEAELASTESGETEPGAGPVEQWQPEPLDRPAAERWLLRAAALTPESFDSPGLGRDLRFESDGMVGASLLVEGRPVHTEFFSEED